mmetsp:Transcript_17607/g.38535  ORF Transcript_17607/g.38535 Transcript_17607/m.38535 type:complete len:932 (-) Transcript_17607:928-3723(-)
MSAPTEVVINGVPIEFPFQPYQIQEEYMRQILLAIEPTGPEYVYGNALLESPTGTGKTLSILCSLLGYIEHQKKQRAESGQTEGRGAVIIYASRTHSQLGQVVRELKNTSYRPKIVVLSSREHMCVNPEVMDKRGSNIRNACAARVKNSSCSYFHGCDSWKAKKGSTARKRGFLETARDEDNRVFEKNLILDIEDLRSLGSREKFCPYYLSRDEDINAEADIVFMPYNYLVDSSVRAKIGLEWSHATVVIDEAHNIESVCESSMSFTFTGSDVGHYINTVNDYVVRMNIVGPELHRCAQFLQLLQGLEEQIKREPLFGTNSGTRDTRKDGGYIFEFLNRAGFDTGTMPTVFSVLEAIRDTDHLENFHHLLVSMFGDLDPERLKENTSKFNEFYSFFMESRDSKEGKIYTVNLWCLSPSVAMNELKRKGIGSIILTSGTLSPLDSFASHLKLPFMNTLENPHVVKPSQFWVGVVKTGVKGTLLNSSYENREKPTYLADLGNTIYHFVRIIPAGVLVFFPSYYVMQVCITYWKRTGIWAKIERVKVPFVEPRSSAEMAKSVEKYEQVILQNKGGIFFAVCRGKASEGIDFSNGKARAVIITGIPFPPMKDPRTTLKRNFLDRERKLLLKTGLGMPISGQEWYTQQAYRAVNQAVGRVIRHRNDYGAVILCDERFQSNRAKTSLSKWLRNNFHVCTSFAQADKELVGFYRENLKDPMLNSTARPSAPLANSAVSRTSGVKKKSVFEVEASRGRTIAPVPHGRDPIRKTMRIEYEPEPKHTSGNWKGASSFAAPALDNKKKALLEAKHDVAREEARKRMRLKEREEKLAKIQRTRLNSIFDKLIASSKDGRREYLQKCKATLSKDEFKKFKDFVKYMRNITVNGKLLSLQEVQPSFDKYIQLVGKKDEYILCGAVYCIPKNLVPVYRNYLLSTIN